MPYRMTLLCTASAPFNRMSVLLGEAPLAAIVCSRYYLSTFVFDKKTMSADELQELQEHAEHASHNPSMAPVSLTMAIIAVVLAIVSLLGHRTHTEEVIAQDKANDQWAYYQAKDTRLNVDKKIADLESFVSSSDSAKATQARETTLAEAAKYEKQVADIQAEARKLDKETELQGRRSDRYDLGEVFLEIALVVTSITLLSGRRRYWYAGLALGVVGVIVAGTAALIR